MQEMNILWADDEIDLLRPHIMLLNEKGYDVKTVTNGNDAVDAFKKGFYDLVAEKTIGTGAFSFPLYPYDRLILKVKESDETYMININTRMFQFDQAVTYLKQKVFETEKRLALP